MASKKPNPYEKVGEVVLINCGGGIVPAAVGGPEFAPQRNTDGRVYLPDGEPFEVIVRACGADHLVASGTASAKPGTLCSIWLRARGEANVPEPPEPKPELREEPEVI